MGEESLVMTAGAGLAHGYRRAGLSSLIGQDSAKIQGRRARDNLTRHRQVNLGTHFVAQPADRWTEVDANVADGQTAIRKRRQAMLKNPRCGSLPSAVKDCAHS